MDANEVVSIEFGSGHNWQKEVLGCQLPIIVDFHATWCGPCKELGPAIEKYFKDEKTFKLVKVDVDENEEIASEYKVEAMPTVMLFSDGKIIKQFQGCDLNELDNMVKEIKNLSIIFLNKIIKR